MQGWKFPEIVHWVTGLPVILTVSQKSKLQIQERWGWGVGRVGEAEEDLPLPLLLPPSPVVLVHQAILVVVNRRTS